MICSYTEEYIFPFLIFNFPLFCGTSQIPSPVEHDSSPVRGQCPFPLKLKSTTGSSWYAEGFRSHEGLRFREESRRLISLLYRPTSFAWIPLFLVEAAPEVLCTEYRSEHCCSWSATGPRAPRRQRRQRTNRPANRSKTESANIKPRTNICEGISSSLSNYDKKIGIGTGTAASGFGSFCGCTPLNIFQHRDGGHYFSRVWQQKFLTSQSYYLFMNTGELPVILDGDAFMILYTRSSPRQNFLPHCSHHHKGWTVMRKNE